MIINLNDTQYSTSKSLIKNHLSARTHYAYVMTFGCQQNEADSEKLRGMLCDLGYILTDDYKSADIILVNTCAIREHAEMKALSMLGNFREVKRNNPDLIVGVVGCMAAEPGVANKLKTDFHYVTFTLEPNMLYRLPDVILKYLTESKRSFIFGEDKGDTVEGIPTVRKSGNRAWVSIMYGCNNFCSYCIVPYVRGRERSRSAKDVIDECRELVKSGIKEITLLGQNVNSYRSDCDFAKLLESIAEIDGDFIIRFMTSHPKDVSDSLIDVMGRLSGKIAPYFHLPLQSGSDKILKAMNRTYNSDKFIEVAKKLKAAVPEICLSTDVIVGFPGETEEDFNETLRVLKTVEFDMVYGFIFSKREGTAAAKLIDDMSYAVKSRRLSELFKMQDDISLRQNQKYLSRVERVLIEGYEIKDGNYVYTARTPSNKLVHFSSDNQISDDFVNITIERACAFDLYGKLI